MAEEGAFWVRSGCVSYPISKFFSPCRLAPCWFSVNWAAASWITSTFLPLSFFRIIRWLWHRGLMSRRCWEKCCLHSEWTTLQFLPEAWCAYWVDRVLGLSLQPHHIWRHLGRMNSCPYGPLRSPQKDVCSSLGRTFLVSVSSLRQINRRPVHCIQGSWQNEQNLIYSGPLM